MNVVERPRSPVHHHQARGVPLRGRVLRDPFGGKVVVEIGEFHARAALWRYDVAWSGCMVAAPASNGKGKR